MDRSSQEIAIVERILLIYCHFPVFSIQEYANIIAAALYLSARVCESNSLRLSHAVFLCVFAQDQNGFEPLSANAYFSRRKKVLEAENVSNRHVVVSILITRQQRASADAFNQSNAIYVRHGD